MSRGFSDFEWYGGNVIKNVEKARRVALTHACKVVQAYAKPMINNVTGNLAGSITYSVMGDAPSAVESPAVQSDGVGRGGKDEGVVGTNVEYARRLEYGFKGTDSLGRKYNQSAKPYLRPALDNNKTKLTKEIGDFIGAAAEAGGK
jgi:HK97 gp10 family phage protein